MKKYSTPFRRALVLVQCGQIYWTRRQEVTIQREPAGGQGTTKLGGRTDSSPLIEGHF